MTSLRVELPPELLDDIAVRAAELVLQRLEMRQPAWPQWMNIDTAARYLDVTPDRLWKLKRAGRIPYVQDGPGARVFFGRDDLDACMKDKR